MFQEMCNAIFIHALDVNHIIFGVARNFLHDDNDMSNQHFKHRFNILLNIG